MTNRDELLRVATAMLPLPLTENMSWHDVVANAGHLLRAVDEAAGPVIEATDEWGFRYRYDSQRIDIAMALPEVRALVKEARLVTLHPGHPLAFALIPFREKS